MSGFINRRCCSLGALFLGISDAAHRTESQTQDWQQVLAAARPEGQVNVWGAAGDLSAQVGLPLKGGPL